MKTFITYLAKGISALFYPLWVPTFGILLFLIALSQSMPLPLVYWLYICGLTLLLTGLMPLLLILIQIRKGDIEDIYITNRKQRTLAYIETVIGFGLWWYLVTFVIKVPDWLSGVALGSTIAIALVAVINLWWKISAHLTSMGGLVAGILVYGIYNFCFPLTTIILALVATLLVIYARLWLDAHTQSQVIAGFALGLFTILITTLIYV